MLSNILSKVLIAHNAKQSIDLLIGEILFALTQKLDAASSTFWFYDETTQRLTLHLTCMGGQIFPEKLPGADKQVPTSFPICQYRTTRLLLSQKQPFIQIIREDDPDLIDHGKWLISEGVKAVLQLPVLIEDKLVGWIPVHKTNDHCWNDEDIELAKTLAHQTAIAIQVTRLSEQAQNAAILEERNRMAREIHDTLAQDLAGILIQLQAVEQFHGHDEVRCQKHLTKIRELAQTSLDEARRSVKRLRPTTLMHLDLAMSIEQLTHTEEGQPRIQLKVGSEFPTLSPEVELELFRIVKEAIINAVKHSDASEIIILLNADPKMISILVQDNGKGLPLTNEPKEGIGLQVMRERAENIAAHFSIESQSNFGTQIIVKLPRS